jgi:hypothetical protein
MKSSTIFRESSESLSPRRHRDNIVIIGDMAFVKGLNHMGHGTKERGKPHGRYSIELVARNRTNKRTRGI